MQINYHKRIFGLDLMRAIAILFVVFSHALWIVPELTGLPKEVLSLMGVLGVEIFFVLSGFLIGRILLHTLFEHQDLRKPIRYFWIRRWFRTLPNYYLILLVNIGIAIFIGRSLPDSLWQYFFFLQNATSSMDLFFVESWSLPIEEVTYIIAPLLLVVFVIKSKTQNRSRLFLWSTMFMLVFGIIGKLGYHFWLSEPDMNFWNQNLKSVTLFRLDAIFYGFLGAYLAFKCNGFWQDFKWVMAIGGALAMLIINLGIPYLGWFITVKPMFWNVVYLPLNSLAIFMFLPLLSAWKSAPKIILKPITYISVLSYAMYLLHYSVVLQLLKHFFPTDELSLLDKGVYTVAYVLITCLASLFLYLLYERPFMNLRDKPRITKKYKPKPVSNSSFY